MRYQTFNSEKSLKQKKLIFDENLFIKVFQNLQGLILVIFPLVLSISFLIIQLKIRNTIFLALSLIIFLFTIFLVIFIQSQIQKSLKLRKTVGIDRKTNMELVQNVIEEKKWKLLKSDNHSHVIRIEKMKIGYHLGRELFILYEDEKIFVRCLTYARFDAIHPFHWISQQKIENSVVHNLKLNWTGKL